MTSLRILRYILRKVILGCRRLNLGLTDSIYSPFGECACQDTVVREGMRKPLVDTTLLPQSIIILFALSTLIDVLILIHYQYVLIQYYIFRPSCVH